MVNGPAAVITKNRSTLLRLHLSLQDSMEDQDGLDNVFLQYIEMQSQLAEPYIGVPQELQMIHGEITKLADNLISHSQRMNSVDLTFYDLRMSMNLLRHRSFYLH